MRFNAQGVIDLTAYRDCEDIDCRSPYTGEHSRDLVYLVGFGTEHERLFLKSTDAIAWANHLGGGDMQLRNDRIMTTELPTRAVIDLYGG